MAPGLLQAEPYEFSSRNSISSGRSSPGHRGNGGNSDYITPIAVVGFSLEFPQDATSPEGFWNMLLEKRCASSEIPKDRLNVDAFHGIDKSRNDIISARGGHFLQDGLSLFDAPFFSISSAEAASMDPQQRKVLECAYRALENAGMPIERVNGSRTSVYTGSFADDYRIMTTKDPESLPKHAATGAAISILANRISWFFNFQGPSVHLDSACSSSMMALDIACQGLRNGDANMALVAGSNTAWSLEPYLVLTNMGMISPDSRCYSFDDRANGYARGEGFGVLILKRLVDAVEDGDTIRAVIRSTGCNSDGRTPGITQPSKDAQETLIKETYAKAGLDLGQTRFFEAHGTGTAIGDPTEADAIGSAFAKYRSPDEPLYVGAVKSNIGHLEGASGVAGVIKAILALEKGVIPPNTNFERMNPRIDAPGLNLRFPTQPLPWPTPGLRRASINSFGFGGSNAHVVLDDAYNFLRLIGISGFHSTAQLPPSPEQLTPANRNSPPSPVEDAVLSDSAIVLGNDDSQPQILVWSAADEGGIKRISDVFNSHFKSHMVAAQDRTEYLSDLAYTLFERRSVLPWKSFAITHSLSELHSAGVSLSKAVRSSSKRTGLGFIFTGQGAQFAGMGRELLSYAVFKRTLQRAELYLHDMGCSWSLMDELLKAKNLSNINNPECSQSICTALQIALIELLRSFDITPNAVVGHSSGEIAAAYCMGGISFRSACKIAYFRGKLSKALAETSRAKGAMIAVGLSEAQVRPYILEVASKFGSAGIVVACINSPKSVTVSGDEGQVEALKMLLDEKSVFSRKLQVDVAYHSPHMEQVAADYQHALSQLETGETIPGCKIMLSSVTNVSVTKRDLCTPDYWVKNLTNPVRFSDAISKLVSGASNVRKKLGGSGGAGGSSNAETVTVYDLLELGPHSALAGPTKDILTTLPRGKEISYLSCLTRNVSAVDTTLSAAGRLWCLGYAVNIDAANRTEPAKFGYKRALTELPEYPFDHSQSYWHESRISKELRLREHSQLNLLGTRSLDWNPLDARWRKYVRLSETPWAQDHVVNGAVIYPAAGMLVMAIEGVRQMAAPGSNRSIKGYRIKEATFERALSIPSSADGAESQLSLRPIHNTLNDISKFEYIISTINDGIWAKNSQGIIQVEYQGDVNEVDDGFEDNFHMERSLELFQERQLNCTCHIESEAIYDHLGKMGLEFGPAFHTLSNVKCNEGEMTGEIKTFECEANSNTNDTQPHLIHPTTLDGFFQLVLIGMTRGTQDLMPATVPTRIDNLWLAPSGLCHSEAKFLRATSKHLTKGQRQDESSFLAMDDHHAVQVSVDILEFTRIDSQQADSSNKPQRRLCYNMDWKPDIELATPDQVQLYCNADRATDAATIAFSKDLESFCEATIFKLLPTIDSSKVDPARTPYLDWMKSRARAYSNEELVNTQLDNIASFDNLAGRLDSSAEGKFYIKVSRCLTEMLYGDISPFEVLVQSDIAKEYQTEIRSRLSAQLSKLVDLLAHKNPEISVLEVGAGAGDTTQCILDSLCLHGNQEGGTPRYSRYDFTDSSRTSLEKAQEKLQQYNSRVKYRLLDIENDVLSQGFVAGTYDLVIAAYSLCAAKDMDKALSNIRSLLKPNGKLVLLERTGRAAYATFALGLLPEWWQVADRYRCAGPTMTSIEWNQALENNGFSGLDVVINDYATPMCQEFSIIASTALEPAANDLLLPKSMILVPNDTGRAQQVAEIIQQKLHSMCSPACVVVTFDQAVILQDISERFCISLLEVDSPVLHKLGRHAFDSLKIVLGSISGLIWTTAGGGHSSGIPEYQTADGFLRSVRTENALLKAVTLALDPSNSEPKAIADAICKVLKGTLSRDISEVETEYMDQIDTLMIPRVVEANYMNDHIHKSADPQETLLQPFGAPNLPPLALDFEKPGLFDSLRFVEDTEASKPLKPYEVEIDVKAIGMNLTDCLAASGRIKRTDMGSECAGIVTRSGNESDFKIGDRVCGIVFGCFKSHARCDNRCLVRIPENLSFADAAALPMACTTVYQTLGVVGRLQQEDTVLIHAAAGGVGQIAIQFAQHLGAEIFATVGSQEKKKLIMDTYGIPSNHIFYSRDTTFAQGVMRMTNGRGVDVILNSLAGEGRAASWECMASFGRFVDIDKRDIHAKLKLDESQFARNVSYAAVDVFGMVRTRPGLIRGALLAAMDLVAEGKVRTSKPMRAYGVSQIEDAFRYMQSGRNIGKVVIDVKKDDIVQTVINRRPSYSFDASGTYMIAGGFGGLARRTARWMANRGARNLLLLGRSGAKSEAAQALVEDLCLQGVHIEAPACDITNAESLSAVLESVSKKMPPIKGCIQGAMVLQDVTYDRMTYEEWQKSTAPKIAGTRNLHELLPSGLDFFIILSSISGIYGSIGQANYAAGGTYQDALAKHRLSQGEKGVVLDLGWMASDGVIAENETLRKAFEMSGNMLPIYADEYLALLDYYCNPALDVMSAPLANQMIVGLKTPAALTADGVDVPELFQRPMFKALHAIGANASPSSADTDGADVKTASYAATFAAAGSLQDAVDVVVDGLTRKLAKALAVPAADIETARPLHAYGVDSLLAVELRGWIAKEFRADVAVFEMMGARSFVAVAGLVAAKSQMRKEDWEKA